MKRTSAIVVVGFLAGLVPGFFAQRVVYRRADAANFAAIGRLNQEDIKATLSQDPQGLADIWDENAVRPNPGSQSAVGKQAIANQNAKFHAEHPGFKVLSYAAKYKDIQIEDGLACEWGEHKGQYKLSAETPPTSWHAAGFHVLRRQGDGTWKFVTIIWKQ